MSRRCWRGVRTALPRWNAFVVPVDACYELAGLCRTHWRGFDGGDDVRREMDAFFARLRSRAS